MVNSEYLSGKTYTTINYKTRELGQKTRKAMHMQKPHVIREEKRSSGKPRATVELK